VRCRHVAARTAATPTPRGGPRFLPRSDSPKPCRARAPSHPQGIRWTAGVTTRLRTICTVPPSACSLSHGVQLSSSRIAPPVPGTWRGPMANTLCMPGVMCASEDHPSHAVVSNISALEPCSYVRWTRTFSISARKVSAMSSIGVGMTEARKVSLAQDKSIEAGHSPWNFSDRRVVVAVHR
jgi:hypothetical protein